MWPDVLKTHTWNSAVPRVDAGWVSGSGGTVAVTTGTHISLVYQSLENHVALDRRCTCIWVNSKCSCSPFFYLFKLDPLLCFSSLSLWPGSMACKVLFPDQGLDPGRGWGALSSNHWATRELPTAFSIEFNIISNLWHYMCMHIYVHTQLYV